MQEMQETQVRSLGQEDPLEKETAAHSSILVWEIPGQRSLVGYSPGGCRVETRLSTHMYTHTATCKKCGWDGDGGRLLGPEGGLGTPRQQVPAVVTHTWGGGACPERDDQSRAADPGPWRRNSLCPPSSMTRVSGPQVGAPRPAAPGKCWKHDLNLRLWVGPRHLTGLTGAPV